MIAYKSATGFVLVAIVTLLFVISMLAGKRIPLINGYHSATLILFLLGMFMCTFGPLGSVMSNGAKSLFLIIGAILGIMALLLAVLAVFKLSIPFVPGERNLFLFMIGVILLKVVLTQVHMIIFKS